MFKRLALISILAVNTCYAKSLTTYQDVVKAYTSGKHVSLVIDWNKCQFDGNERWTMITAYETQSAFITNYDSLIIRGFTYRNQLNGNSDSGPVNLAYEYVLSKNGNVNFKQKYVDPVTYKEKRNETSVTCELGTSFKAFAI